MRAHQIHQARGSALGYAVQLIANKQREHFVRIVDTEQNADVITLTHSDAQMLGALLTAQGITAQVLNTPKKAKGWLP